MTKKITEYEKNKQAKKQLLVRNEFLYHKNSDGKYDFPIIKKQDIDIKKIKFLSYTDCKLNDGANKDKTIHFFTYDWKFEKVYEEPSSELEKLSQYYCVLSPDFSIFTNMPLALQIESIFKNRWCGAYFQSKGIRVIPTISWGDEKSFDFCFDGIEEGSTVAVCTYYRENCEDDFMPGYNEMIKRIKPRQIICYGEPFKSMKGNIVEFLPTTYEWTRELSWDDLARFKWEKQHLNICGLNKSDFKYFDYDDPYALDQLKKCDVCGKIVATDQYGNGKCKNCGWHNNHSANKFPNSVEYPNMVSLTKARAQFAANQPFSPSFEDFVEALTKYSEMELEYNGTTFYVYFFSGKQVAFGCKNFEKRYLNLQDFIEHASINNALLKDIWKEIKNANYMS